MNYAVRLSEFLDRYLDRRQGSPHDTFYMAFLDSRTSRLDSAHSLIEVRSVIKGVGQSYRIDYIYTKLPPGNSGLSVKTFMDSSDVRGWTVSSDVAILGLYRVRELRDGWRSFRNKFLLVVNT